VEPYLRSASQRLQTAAAPSARQPITIAPCRHVPTGRPRTQPDARAESSDQRDANENAEPAVAAEAIEHSEPIEPTDPTERMEPDDPIERIEPSLEIERMEPVDRADHSDPPSLAGRVLVPAATFLGMGEA
jgi:hypothetical protein